MSIARHKDHLLRSFEEAKKLFGNKSLLRNWMNCLFCIVIQQIRSNRKNEKGDNTSLTPMQKLDANIYYPFKFSEKQGARRFIPSWSPYAIGLLIIFVAIAFVCVVNP